MGSGLQGVYFSVLQFHMIQFGTKIIIIIIIILKMHLLLNIWTRIYYL